jgi:hypothetical protein
MRVAVKIRVDVVVQFFDAASHIFDASLLDDPTWPAMIGPCQGWHRPPRVNLARRLAGCEAFFCAHCNANSGEHIWLRSSLTIISAMNHNPCAEYLRLRRRYWRLYFTFVGVLIALMVPLSLLELAKSTFPLPTVVATQLAVFLPGFAFIAIIAWKCAVAWSKLLFWRCPRCGRFFMLAWYSSWPTNYCKHCGLDAAGARPTDHFTSAQEL